MPSFPLDGRPARIDSRVSVRRTEKTFMRPRRLQGFLLAATCAIGAVGCATTANQGKGGGDDDDREFICADTPPTGSNISRMRCTAVKDAEDRRNADREKMEKLHFGTARPREVAAPPRPR
jgi:hypothetical protein